MSNDPLMDHLENMSGMNSSRHHEQPYCYHTTDEQEAEIAAQAVADDAARRMARNTTDDTKRTALAMGVDLLGDFRFMEGHRCTSDCRREGCEVVQGWQRRAEAE